MRHYIFISLVVAVVISCTKVEHQKNLYIRGRLFLNDTVTLNVVDSPLAHKRVVLAENNGDSLNYLYADTTDADGHFLFDLLNDGKTSFVVRYEETVNTYLYSASDTVSKNENNIAVVASLNQTRQNGLHLIVKDNNGTRISNVTAWIFNNQSLWTTGTSTGKIFDLVTNSYGVSSKLNLVPGTYYVTIKTRVGNIDFLGTGSTNITTTGIQPLPITLVQNRTGFELLIWDNQNTPVNNAQVYGYRSLNVFVLDSSYTNNIISLSSSSSGQCSSYNIDAGRYYLRTIKQIGNIVLTSGDTIDVTSNTVTLKTIKLN